MNWIVVTDFDGTISEKDIGNELCKEALGLERFQSAQDAYRRGELSLKDMQKGYWERFPMPEARFRERTRFHAKLRPGVPEFLKKCEQHDIPVYVASCGLRPYIEEALDAQLAPEVRRLIREIRCNEARFDAVGISHFIPPETTPDCQYPLDKGAWADEVRAKLSKPGQKLKLLGIGNGTSDRSFWPKVDQLAATEGLARWCETQKVPYTPFEDFRDLLKLEIFS